MKREDSSNEILSIDSRGVTFYYETLAVDSLVKYLAAACFLEVRKKITI
jgi:hypothetical protein